MPQIASYYASVGIDFDIKSLKRADAYMKRIEKTLNGFKKRTEKATNVTLRVKIDRAALIKTLTTDLNRISKTLVVPLNRFKVNQGSLSRAISSAATGAHGTLKLNTVISQASLSYMRQQVRQSLSNIAISPTINPRVSRTGSYAPQAHHGGGQGGKSNTYNPMLVGGATGAFMRFGAYSLPFVAGAYGLNAMGNAAQEIQSQRNMLYGVSGSDQAGAQHEQYLTNLADRLGMRKRDLVPGFSQMMAASMGTDMEPHLLPMFDALTEYGAVMNLTPEQVKLTNRAFTQMISKQQIMAEELD